MCQNLPSLDADPAQTIGAGSAFTDHEPVTGSPRVHDSMPRFDSLEPPGKSNRLRCRDWLDLIVAGTTTTPSPTMALPTLVMRR